MARDEIVASRMDYGERVRVEAASAVSGRSRSAFVRNAAVREARNVIRQAREKRPTGRDRDGDGE